MKNVTMDLASLWSKFARNPEETGEIELAAGKRLRYSKDEDDYFDLFTKDGLVCMDGETCNVTEKEGGIFECWEVDEKKEFILTKAEYEVAAC